MKLLHFFITEEGYSPIVLRGAKDEIWLENLDENYKIGNGESQKEVSNRMHSTIMKILRENKNKRIAIVSHATAISYLLKKWCDIQVVDDKLKYSFNNNILLNGYFNYCETFKLEFDDNYELISIQNINLD